MMTTSYDDNIIFARNIPETKKLALEVILELGLGRDLVNLGKHQIVVFRSLLI